MRPSTATTTAAWRSRRPPAPSHRRGRGLGPWLCQRTTMRGPPPTAALARWNTRRTVRPGGVSPPCTPYHLLHQSIDCEGSRHKQTTSTLLAFTHINTAFITHTHLVSKAANVVHLIKFPQFPVLRIPSLKSCVAAQHNQYAT